MPGDRIQVIFLFPLALSVIATLFYLFQDSSWPAKLFAAGLLATSIFLQFQPFWNVHFLVPLMMQLTICLWMALYFRLS